MVRLSSKHSGTTEIVYSDLAGGMNASKAAELLAMNEAEDILNWEYNAASNVLRVRRGYGVLVSGLPDIVNELYYSPTINTLLASVGSDIYRINPDGTYTFIGELAGAYVPVFCDWGDIVLVASGGQLQKYDGTTLTIIDSPYCDFVSTKSGRVVLSHAGDEYINLSGVGDETNWSFSGTASDAVRIRPGYKTGGSIISVRLFFSDLIVFRSNHRIFRVVGDYPDWTVEEVSSNASTFNAKSSLALPTGLVFVDSGGICKLTPTSDYGDIRINYIGDKINRLLVDNLADDYVRIWHDAKNSQILVKGDDSGTVYVLNYAIGAWTRFVFGEDINAFAVTASGKTYIGIENGIYELSDIYDKDNDVDIDAEIKWPRKTGVRDILTKHVKLVYRGLTDGQATLNVGKFQKDFSFIAPDSLLYDATTIWIDDTEPLNTSEQKFFTKNTNFTSKDLQPILTVSSGRLEFIGLQLEVVNI